MNLTDRTVLLKQAFVNTGVVPATASDGDVAAAEVALKSSDPVKYNQILTAGGVPPQGMSMLTLIGLGAGAIALYFIWKNYSKKRVLDVSEYPEPEDNVRPRLHSMSQALGAFRGSTFKGRSPRRRSMGCSGRPRGMGDKYEFEPEIRLEGYRRHKARSKR
jgi:hypothetical protein